MKQYTFKSFQTGTAIVTLDGNTITIKRKGLLALLNYGLKGEKTIFIKQITGVQLKEAGITLGYLQISVGGYVESKGGLQRAMRDENTICFDGGLNPEKTNTDIREIKKYIEDRIS